jgi:hypothetical protein
LPMSPLWSSSPSHPLACLDKMFRGFSSEQKGGKGKFATDVDHHIQLSLSIDASYQQSKEGVTGQSVRHRYTISHILFIFVLCLIHAVTTRSFPATAMYDTSSESLSLPSTSLACVLPSAQSNTMMGLITSPECLSRMQTLQVSRPEPPSFSIVSWHSHVMNRLVKVFILVLFRHLLDGKLALSMEIHELGNELRGEDVELSVLGVARRGWSCTSPPEDNSSLPTRLHSSSRYKSYHGSQTAVESQVPGHRTTPTSQTATSRRKRSSTP